MTLSAISPRFAIKILRNMSGWWLCRANSEQRLSVLDGPAVLDQLRDHCAGDLCFNLVHQLHGFNNAKHLAKFNMIANFNKWWSAGPGSIVVRSNNRGFHNKVP